jgi:Leucine-rich repeat (LRR) protein
VLPGAISSLSGLTALRLNHNQLSYLPQELATLSGLVLFDARWAARPAELICT